MSNKRDMRRVDLVVPYIDPPAAKNESDLTSTFTSTLPMVAIFTRSKVIGWTAVTFAVQGWMADSTEGKASSSSPGIFGVLMAVMALAMSYMQLFIPPKLGTSAAAGVGTPQPAA